MADEAIGARQVGGRQHEGPLRALRVRETMVHVVRRVQPQPGVPMLRVVPAKEVHAVDAGVLERAEAVGEIRAILERLELRFGIRIVIRHRRP